MQRFLRAHCVCAQDLMTSQTCSDVDRVFVIVTPSILSVVTCSMSTIGGGDKTRRFLLPSLKTVSRVFFRLSAKLFFCSHASIPSISDTRECTLHAGTIKYRYVSPANLHIALPGVVTFKSAAVTTYDAGPIAEPCMILALIIWTVDC